MTDERTPIATYLRDALVLTQAAVERIAEEPGRNEALMHAVRARTVLTAALAAVEAEP